MKAIVIFSGGLDSTVLLAGAISKNRECMAITFDYGQRHAHELQSATKIAAYYNINHHIIQIDPTSFDKSTLLGKGMVPQNRTLDQINSGGVPSTYVPGRNTLFLAYAAAQAEILDAEEIYFGSNAADSTPYPDTRPEFLNAYQALLNLATKQALEGKAPQLIVPFLKYGKREIIQQGISLKAPLELTLSCYDPDSTSRHCGRCDACYLRKEGFIAAGVEDPTEYLVQGVPLEAVSLHELV